MARKIILTKLLQDETGATAVEYGLILGLIVIFMIASFDSVATATIDMWNDVATKSSDAIGGG